MNPVIMIIAIFLVIMSVLFGKNPVEEARKEREKKRAGRDALIEAIDDHNAKYKPAGIFPTFPPSGQATPGNPNYPGYMRRGENPYAPMTRPNQGEAPAPESSLPQAAPAPSYYPPPPIDESQRKKNPFGPQSNLSPFYQKPRFITPEGQKISFLGTEVYTTDEQGNKKPVPDGVYPLDEEGKIKMLVRGGQRVLISN